MDYSIFTFMNTSSFTTPALQYSNTPTLQHSSTPTLLSIYSQLLDIFHFALTTTISVASPQTVLEVVNPVLE